jgi:tetratricopeptide (TPR) repeat protein
MKVVLIFLAIVFVGGFVTVAADPFGAGQQAAQPATDPLSAINQQYQPTVTALTNQLRSEPESYTVLVSLGNTYFDWAVSVQQGAQQSPQLAGADQPLWISAKDAYRRAVEIRDDEPPVLVDYAITLFYTGETNRAIEYAERAIEVDDEFAPAWFNRGIFVAELGQREAAIESFERAVELDPQGQQVNTEFANQQLTQLRSQSGTAPSEPATPTP